MKKLLIIWGIFVLAACSNPKDPTESNFKSAIQDYYSKKHACLNIRAEFPYQIVKSDYSYQRDSDALNELVSLGFLASSETEKEVKVYFGNQPTKKEPAITYELTEKGKGITKPPEKGFFSMGGTDFCYGEYEVDQVTNFTEPADFMGQKVSQVNFTYKAHNVADWAKTSKALQGKFQELSRDIKSVTEPIDGKAALILTNNGWVHEKLFKN